jgi:hypothetical protein
MKEKQIFGVLFVIGILIALIGATLMWFGIFPVPLRITIVILGISLIALSNPISKSKNI